METARAPQDVYREDDRPPTGQKPQARPEAILWNTPQIAAYLNVKESTIRYWVHVKYIPHIKFQSLVRFRQTDIDAWLLNRTAPGRSTSVKATSEKILQEIQDRPRRGRAPGVRT